MTDVIAQGWALSVPRVVLNLSMARDFCIMNGAVGTVLEDRYRDK